MKPTSNPDKDQGRGGTLAKKCNGPQSGPQPRHADLEGEWTEDSRRLQKYSLTNTLKERSCWGKGMYSG